MSRPSARDVLENFITWVEDHLDSDSIDNLRSNVLTSTDGFTDHDCRQALKYLASFVASLNGKFRDLMKRLQVSEDNIAAKIRQADAKDRSMSSYATLHTLKKAMDDANDLISKQSALLRGTAPAATRADQVARIMAAVRHVVALARRQVTDHQSYLADNDFGDDGEIRIDDDDGYGYNPMFSLEDDGVPTFADILSHFRDRDEGLRQDLFVARALLKAIRGKLHDLKKSVQRARSQKRELPPDLERSESEALNGLAHLSVQKNWVQTIGVMQVYVRHRPYFEKGGSSRRGHCDWAVVPQAVSGGTSMLWRACVDNKVELVRVMLGGTQYRKVAEWFVGRLDPTGQYRLGERDLRLMKECHMLNLHEEMQADGRPAPAAGDESGRWTLFEKVAHMGDDYYRVAKAIVDHDPSVVAVYASKSAVRENRLLNILTASKTVRMRELVLGNSCVWQMFRLRDGTNLAHSACINLDPSTLAAVLLPRRAMVDSSFDRTHPPGHAKSKEIEKAKVFDERAIDVKHAVDRFAYQVLVHSHNNNGDTVLMSMLRSVLEGVPIRRTQTKALCRTLAIASMLHNYTKDDLRKHESSSGPGGMSAGDAYFLIKNPTEHMERVADAWKKKFEGLDDDVPSAVDKSSKCDWPKFWKAYASIRNNRGENLDDLVMMRSPPSPARAPAPVAQVPKPAFPIVWDEVDDEDEDDEDDDDETETETDDYDDDYEEEKERESFVARGLSREEAIFNPHGSKTPVGLFLRDLAKYLFLETSYFDKQKMRERARKDGRVDVQPERVFNEMEDAFAKIISWGSAENDYKEKENVLEKDEGRPTTVRGKK